MQLKALSSPGAKRRHRLKSDNNCKKLGYRFVLNNLVGVNRFSLQNKIEDTYYTAGNRTELGMILHDIHFSKHVLSCALSQP